MFTSGSFTNVGTIGGLGSYAFLGEAGYAYVEGLGIFAFLGFAMGTYHMEWSEDGKTLTSILADVSVMTSVPSGNFTAVTGIKDLAGNAYTPVPGCRQRWVLG